MKKLTLIAILLAASAFAKKGMFLDPLNGIDGFYNCKRYGKVAIQQEIFNDSTIMSQKAFDEILNKLMFIGDSIAEEYDFKAKRNAKRLFGEKHRRHCSFFILDQSFMDYHSRYFVQNGYIKRITDSDGYRIFVNARVYFSKHKASDIYDFARKEMTLQIKYFKIRRAKLSNTDFRNNDVTKRLPLGYSVRDCGIANIYTKNHEDVRAQTLGQELMDFYINLCYLYDVKPKRRVDVIISNRGELRVVTPGFAKWMKGSYSNHRASVRSAYDLKSTLETAKHELCHNMQDSRMKNMDVMTVFLLEGEASFFEYEGLDHEGLLAVTNSNDWESLSKLAGQHPASIRGYDAKRRFYVVSHAFVSFLIEKHGIKKWVKYVNALNSCSSSREGCFEDKMKSVYGKNLYTFQAGFDKYVAKALGKNFKGDRRAKVAIHLMGQKTRK